MVIGRVLDRKTTCLTFVFSGEKIRAVQNLIDLNEEKMHPCAHSGQ
jgi:hypothetical protein